MASALNQRKIASQGDVPGADKAGYFD